MNKGIFHYLGEEYAELFERLEQAGISDLLDDKDTFGRLVPCQSLAGGVLDVPEHKKHPTISPPGTNKQRQIQKCGSGVSFCLSDKQNDKNDLQEIRKSQQSSAGKKIQIIRKMKRPNVAVRFNNPKSVTLSH